MRRATGSIGAAILVATGLAGTARDASALSFGRASNNTHLGQPLDFTVQLRFDEGEYVAAECVVAEVIAGEERLSAADVHVAIDAPNAAGERLLHVTTSSPIAEPVANMSVNVGCPASLSRKFVAFVDPPTLNLAQAVPAPLPPAPAASKPAEPPPAVSDTQVGIAKPSAPRRAPAPRVAAAPEAASAPRRPRVPRTAIRPPPQELALNAPPVDPKPDAPREPKPRAAAAPTTGGGPRLQLEAPPPLPAPRRATPTAAAAPASSAASAASPARAVAGASAPATTAAASAAPAAAAASKPTALAAASAAAQAVTSAASAAAAAATTAAAASAPPVVLAAASAPAAAASSGAPAASASPAAKPASGPASAPAAPPATGPTAIAAADTPAASVAASVAASGSGSAAGTVAIGAIAAATPGAGASSARADASTLAAGAEPTAQERMHALEERLKLLQVDALSDRVSVATLQAQLRESERARDDRWTIRILLGVIALMMVMMVALFAWMRRREQQRDAWWAASMQRAESRFGAVSPVGEARDDEPAAPAPAGVVVAMPRHDEDLPAEIAPGRLMPPQLETTETGPAAFTPWMSSDAAAEREAQSAAQRAAAVEALIDVQQQVAFFLALDQDDAALESLGNHLRSVPLLSPLPMLELMEIHRRRGDLEAFRRVADEYGVRFAVPTPVWNATEPTGAPLGDAAQRSLERVWPTPPEAMKHLERLLLWQDDGLPFDAEAYRDLLFLYEIARRLAAGDDEDGGIDGLSVTRVDFELPLGAAASGGMRVTQTLLPSQPMPLDAGFETYPRGSGTGG